MKNSTIEQKLYSLSNDNIAVVGFLFALIQNSDLSSTLKRATNRDNKQEYEELCLKAAIYIVSEEPDNLKPEAFDLLEKAEVLYKTLLSHTSLLRLDSESLESLNKNKVNIASIVTKRDKDNKDNKDNKSLLGDMFSFGNEDRKKKKREDRKDKEDDDFLDFLSI